MKNVAYKTNQTNPNLPAGFIIEHFETDEDSVEGYLVIRKEAFSQMMLNNVSLMRGHESKTGIQAADPRQPGPLPRPNSDAQPVDQAMMAQKEKQIQQETQDAELFMQFLQWKRSQSGAGGTGGTGGLGGSGNSGNGNA